MPIDKASELEDRLSELDIETLRSILEDIWIEDERLEDLHDLDASDMTGGIMEWVTEGAEDKLWTIESWTAEILDDPESPYMDKVD